ncbi:MAG: alpha-hydroxy-acid oxidizing protein [Treponema sp.]|nr:alpha-hydroxy-acid oxidizing protein [Treponema sp.]
MPEINRDSNEITRQYFDSLLLETRYIDSELADTKIKLFGEEFSMPVATAALSHLNNTAPDGMVKMAEGAYKAGALCFCGMGELDELKSMCATGAKIVKIVKPHENNDIAISVLRACEVAGVFALGMDIDHAFAGNGEYDNVLGVPVKSKSTEELRSFVAATKLPFIVKGVLSVQDAKKAVEIGAAGIIVSHHHGIMDYAVPPLMVLPKIKEAVGDKLTIFVDCCIESGMDAFKALALGADAVCVGRAIMPPLKEKGSDGVKEKLEEINRTLRATMNRTGFKTLVQINDSVIYKRNF